MDVEWHLGVICIDKDTLLRGSRALSSQNRIGNRIRKRWQWWHLHQLLLCLLRHFWQWRTWHYLVANALEVDSFEVLVIFDCIDVFEAYAILWNHCSEPIDEVLNRFVICYRKLKVPILNFLHDL